MDAALLVSNAKGSCGLSVRALAARAGVAGSTITRIQAGAVDPTVDTLVRLLEAAGYDLQLSAIRQDGSCRPHLADLADAWTRGRNEVSITWPRWRSFLDDLALHPERVPEAIYSPPPPAGDPVIDALLAAIAEKLADDAGLTRPSWTRDVPQLERPYRPPVVRPDADRPIPTQFAARGLMIDEGSLWRDPATVGV